MMTAACPSTCAGQDFTTALANGRFIIQKSAASGRYILYPRLAEPRSGRRDLAWEEACGDGIIYATTTIYPRRPAQPYNVAIITLAEGPRIMSRVEGIAPDAVMIGMAVHVTIGHDDHGPVLLFRPGSAL